MIKKIAEMVGKKTENEKNIEELAVVQGSINEVTAHTADLETIKKGLELELKLGTDSALEKRFKKLTTATEKAHKELDDLRARQDELSQAIATEEAKQKQAKIDEAAKAHSEQTYVSFKRRLVEMEAERLTSRLYGKTGLHEPQELKRLVGLRYGEHFDPADPEHALLIEASNKAGASGREKAEREYEELKAKIEAFIEMTF